MPAPKGNQFWKLRSKHGPEATFSDPELLWNEAVIYFNWCDAHPLWKNEPIKSGNNAGKIIKVSVARPYTQSGLMNFLHQSENYWRKFRLNKKITEDMRAVVVRIDQTIRTQQIEGGVAGFYKENLVARLNGLADKTELTGEDGGPIQIENDDIDYDKLSPEILKALMAARKPRKNTDEE